MCWKRVSGGGSLALGLLIGSRTGVLVTYLRFPSTEGSFSGGMEEGRERGRRPDALIDDCHLLHCGRAGPAVTETVRTKL